MDIIVEWNEDLNAVVMNSTRLLMSWDDYLSAINKAVSICKEHEGINNIAVISIHEGMPPTGDALRQLRNAWNSLRRVGATRLIIVTTNRFLQVAGGHFARFIPQGKADVVDTIEEAYTLLANAE